MPPTPPAGALATRAAQNVRVRLHLALRAKIVLFTVLPVATLVIGALWMVNRTISSQVQHGIRASLLRSTAVLENMLNSESRQLSIHGRVIARDPHFLSVSLLPNLHGSSASRARVAAVARSFNAITSSEVFEILDPQGRVVASVGARALDPRVRRKLARAALAGNLEGSVESLPDGQYLVTPTPVVSAGRVQGILLLGSRIGAALAQKLRSFTRSEVTFFSGQVQTLSTLPQAEEREALSRTISAVEQASGLTTSPDQVLEVRTSSDVYLTLARHLPRTAPAERQVYVMQRPLSRETEFLRTMQAGLVQLGVIALIVALLAGFLVAERILAPVRRLVRGAEEMEVGNFDYPLDLTSHDEIGYLATRFDEMRRQQRAYINSLEDAARVKSEFITVASHELRTPISVVQGYEQLMLDGQLGPVTNEQRAALESIARSVTDLTRIAENATRMAQIQGERLVLARETQEVAPLVAEAVQTALAEAPTRRLRISASVEPDIGAACVDGPRMVHAIANLVRNGIRFTPDGGEITVTARPDGDWLEVVVRDTGVGIPREKQAYVFGRAHMMRDWRHHHSSGTLEFNSAGLGLGLSVALGIVEAHGGTMILDSEPGRGSSFTARFPRDAAPRLEMAA
jgi:signal transduction histidine kinase